MNRRSSVRTPSLRANLTQTTAIITIIIIITIITTTIIITITIIIIIYIIYEGLLTVEMKGKKNVFNGRILEIEGR